MGVFGLYGIVGRCFLSTIGIQKVRRLNTLVGRVKSAECSLAEGEQGATTLLGLAPPTFVRILTSAFKSATAALAAWFGGRCALDMFRHHGFLYCAVDCRLKAFGVGALCSDLCSESVQRVRVDVYLVAVFQHQYIQYAENIYA